MRVVGVQCRQLCLLAVFCGLVIDRGPGEVTVIDRPLGHDKGVSLLNHAPCRDSQERNVAAEALARLPCNAELPSVPDDFQYGY